MESCELCRGLKGHSTLQRSLYNRLNCEYRNACDEFEFLSSLFRDCCWYNFETVCRNWEEPWHESWAGSHTQLHGIRALIKNHALHLTYPIWYRGTIKDAPPLPPLIIYKELQDAKAYMLYMKEQRWAPYDYAPGGHKYEKLLRYGEGVKAYTELSSKQ